MKKIFTVLLTVLTLGSAIAQTPHSQKKLSQKNNSPRWGKFAAAIIKSDSYRITESTIKQRLDSAVSEYEKNVFAYDNNGNCIGIDAFERDTYGSPWIQVEKVNYAYNTNNLLISEIIYGLDDVNNILFIIEKFNYNYNTNGTPALMVKSITADKGATYTPDYKEIFTYNGTQVAFIESYNYNVTKKTYEYDVKYTETFDSKGNLVLETAEFWDANTNGFILGFKQESTYNSDNLQTLNTQYEKHAGVWVAINKRDYTYDNYKNLISELHSENTSDALAWEALSKDNFTYNLTYTLAQIVGPEELFTPSIRNNMISTEVISYYRSGEWSDDPEITYYYSPMSVTGINDITNATTLKIYPNPASDYIVITAADPLSVSHISISDLQGNTLVSLDSVTENKTSVKHLNRGLYIYQITGRNQVISGKIVIE